MGKNPLYAIILAALIVFFVRIFAGFLHSGILDILGYVSCLIQRKKSIDDHQAVCLVAFAHFLHFQMLTRTFILARFLTIEGG
jgi:hypothetical protein